MAMKGRVVKRLVLLFSGLLIGLIVWAYVLIFASLPVLTGKIDLKGLAAEVVVERDANGVATITGRERDDLARATGFVHAQERFFQMDLLRRKAAGELAALLGPGLFNVDKQHRIHGFRQLAQQVSAKSEQVDLLAAYTQGVNQGLEAMKVRPFEYVLLRAEPEPWRSEDSVLVIYAMYLELQGQAYKQDALLGAMQQHLPPNLFSFLTPRGTPWDAPLDDSQYELNPLPSELVTLQEKVLLKQALTEQIAEISQVGSNSWAVNGRLSSHGGALLAGDMHLGLNVPNIWYRLKLDWTENGESFMVSGVSLPGLPFVLAGSNGHLAWTFTNSYGDWMDLVNLDVDPLNSQRYKTSEGWVDFDERKELIPIRGESARSVSYQWSRWGPLLDDVNAGNVQQKIALRWTAHQIEATNLNLAKLERARSLGQGLLVAQQSGSPVQNILLVDHEGRLGWTLMGQLPQRAANLDTRLPISWQLAETTWRSWLSPQDYPREINSNTNFLWSANGRMVGGEALDKIGDGGYALGARATQIKAALQAKNTFTEADLLQLQLDDRAPFLTRWHHLLTKVLSDEAVRGSVDRQELKALVAQWDGKASVDAVSYRLVRAFRLFLAQRVFEMLLQPVLTQSPGLNYLDFSKYEGPLWQLIEAEPVHMLSEEYESWLALYLSVVDEVIDYFHVQGLTLSQATWGTRNTLRMQHPLAMAVPLLEYFLDMPSDQLPGDIYMPRVQGPSFGSSQRLVVSPGREHLGVMHMPGGQSGHPLSPFYMAGHDDWVAGRPTPFLPGKAHYTLRLLPPK